MNIVSTISLSSQIILVGIGVSCLIWFLYVARRSRGGYVSCSKTALKHPPHPDAVTLPSGRIVIPIRQSKIQESFTASAKLHSPCGPYSLDLVKHLTAQRDFSLATFGPGQKTVGVLANIRKELVEIEANPADLVEWMDVALLAFDGAMRNGGTPEVVVQTLAEKFARNQTRQWPDWRTQPDDQPIEHVRNV